MTNETHVNYSHQEGIFNPVHARKVNLLGAGSVGSWTALFLAKMGVAHIEVWDADHVASHNSPMSLYGPLDFGRFKVDVLAERVKDLAGVSLIVHRKMYEGELLQNTSVVACVDTMAARKSVWERVKNCPSVDIFCDTRTAAAYIDVLSIAPCDPDDINNYEAMSFSDSRAARQTCGRHGIVFGSTRAAQIVTATLAMFWQSGRKEWRVAEQCESLKPVSFVRETD